MEKVSRIMNRLNIQPSGIPLIDEKWGGVYNNSSYLLIGPRKSGRSLLALQYAIECAKQKQVCLYFSSVRPKDLMILAASLDIDLEYYMGKNLIIVVKVAFPEATNEYTSNDSYLAEFLGDIVKIVEEFKPKRIVFDEITSLIGFNDTQFLRDTYQKLIETIEDDGITSLFIVREPASDSSEAIVSVLVSCSTGVIYLSKMENEGFPQGEITIIPNIGHNEGKFTALYKVEGREGLVLEFPGNVSSETKTDSKIFSEPI